MSACVLSYHIRAPSLAGNNSFGTMSQNVTANLLDKSRLYCKLNTLHMLLSDTAQNEIRAMVGYYSGQTQMMTQEIHCFVLNIVNFRQGRTLPFRTSPNNWPPAVTRSGASWRNDVNSSIPFINELCLLNNNDNGDVWLDILYHII